MDHSVNPPISGGQWIHDLCGIIVLYTILLYKYTTYTHESILFFLIGNRE